VLATGYKGQEDLVARLFGEAVAARVGPIWGFGDGMELRNMFVRTPQPGLWFIAGSLAQCRIYSKYLALQIKACEAGLLGGRPCRTDAGAPAAGASAGPHSPAPAARGVGRVIEAGSGGSRTPPSSIHLSEAGT
jgi:hypothetical protein